MSAPGMTCVDSESRPGTEAGAGAAFQRERGSLGVFAQGCKKLQSIGTDQWSPPQNAFVPSRGSFINEAFYDAFKSATRRSQR